jgi:anaerobic selenocysteine-containing dehydrogenase
MTVPRQLFLGKARLTFSKHTLTELRTWTDLDLEDNGRLTHPMRYDAASDKYVPVVWKDAFQAIGDELKKLEPSSVVFYSSGRASLEASYMYQLFGRMYGTNNFPDSSNMCHESTSVALPEVIGVPVGTVRRLRARPGRDRGDLPSILQEFQ